MQLRNFTVFLFLGLATAAHSRSESLQQVLQRMDRAAADFKAMTAQVTYVTHTDVLNEDSKETGTAILKKMQADDVQGLVEFVTPDRKAVSFEKHAMRVYYPKINTIQAFDIDKTADPVKFVLIGFGISGNELAKDYDVSVLPNDNSVPASVHLQLTPKSAEAKQYMTKVELWIPEQGDPYPMREKITQPSKDYRLVMYSDLKINPPLQADALQLKPAPGVKIEHPGR